MMALLIRGCVIIENDLSVLEILYHHHTVVTVSLPMVMMVGLMFFEKM
jgi:hypothetical protein